MNDILKPVINLLITLVSGAICFIYINGG